MKIFKSPQKVLILFLSVLIVISFIMILRLEGKTASLQSQWQNHQSSLQKNEDILDKLNVFARLVKNNAIRLDGNNIVLMSGSSVIGLEDKGVGVTTDGNIQIDNQSGSELIFEKENVILKVKGDIQIGPSKDKYIGYNAKEDRLYIHHSGSEIFLGQIYSQGKPFANGIFMRGKDGGPYLTVNERNLRLVAPMKAGLYDITIDPENKMLGINCGKSFIVIEKDNIKIDTPGDINITSTNGNVNIRGKKVSLNE
jgi:hypothetical protein